MTLVLVALTAFLIGGVVTAFALGVRPGGSGRHAQPYVPKHRGWEGREDELSQFTASFLLAREASLPWPSQADTDRFEAVTHG